MLSSGTRPPSGVKLSCIALTEPLEAAVVAVAQSAELAMPKRDLLALHVAGGGVDRRAARASGLPARSAPVERRRSRARNRTAIAAKIAQPWRLSPHHAGRRCSRTPPGSAGSTSISRKFESGVGFSKGWAELALKKPPPLVPSCLIAICEAAGPCASICSAALERRRRRRRASRFCGTPCQTSTSAPTIESGSRT